MGALIVRIGFFLGGGGISYYNYNDEPPQTLFLLLRPLDYPKPKALKLGVLAYFGPQVLQVRVDRSTPESQTLESLRSSSFY